MKESRWIVLLLGLAACARPPAPEPAVAPMMTEPIPTPAPSPEELAKIAEDAWIWGYPLVLSEVTMRQMTDTAEPGPFRAPLGQLAHPEGLADPSTRYVVRPNVDTLYTVGWVDLSTGPTVLHLPDMGERYHVVSVLDGWGDAVASLGSRTTGNAAGDYLIAGPDWTGEAPEGMRAYHASTNLVWIGGRTAVKGPSDLAAAKKAQEGYTLTPLTPTGAIAPTPMPPDDRDPATIVETMDGPTYFRTLADALRTNPPRETDSQAVGRFTAIGLVPGAMIEPGALPDGAVEAMSAAPTRAMARLRERLAATPKSNGWMRSSPHAADFGDRYEERAAFASIGFLANLQDDAVYWATTEDGTGAPLTGEQRYRMRFPPNETPPTHAFWSVTLYDADGYLVKNDLGRYSRGSEDALARGADGAVDILIQRDAPDKKLRSNWLPAPEGNYNLALRVYWPDRPVLDGTWQPPPVEPVTRGTK